MSSSQSPEFFIHRPPSRPEIKKPSIILYGSIEPNAAVDWQTELASSLADLPITVLNPRRDDWDNSWIEDISFPKFKDQVEWEMDFARVADVIVFYFAPGTSTPITLLELGMYAETGRAVVCCPPGFYKRGNVQMVCLRYDIPLIEGLDELKELVRQRLANSENSKNA